MAIGTTAAILGSAAIGLAGNGAAGAMQAGAAKKAADAQVQAAEIATGYQRDATQQARIDSYPWALAGAQSLYAYMDELGIPRPETMILPDLTQGPFAVGQTTGQQAQPTQAAPQATPAQNNLNRTPYEQSAGGYVAGMAQNSLANTPSAPTTASPATAQPNALSVANMPMTARRGFTETPGYAFQVSEGEKGVMNNLAALGMKNSGAALKSLTRFRTGVANQEYGNYLNRLAGMAGMGQSQTNATNALTSSAATNIGNIQQNAGAARASGYINAGNDWANAIGNSTNMIGNALGQLSYYGN